AARRTERALRPVLPLGRVVVERPPRRRGRLVGMEGVESIPWLLERREGRPGGGLENAPRRPATAPRGTGAQCGVQNLGLARSSGGNRRQGRDRVDGLDGAKRGKTSPTTAGSTARVPTALNPDRGEGCVSGAHALVEVAICSAPRRFSRSGAARSANALPSR